MVLRKLPKAPGNFPYRIKDGKARAKWEIMTLKTPVCLLFLLHFIINERLSSNIEPQGLSKAIDLLKLP